MVVDSLASVKNKENKLKKIQVIINPAAGVDRPLLGMLNSKFVEAGIEWDARITHGAGDAVRLTNEALAMGCDMVIANGGDGTVMEVGSALHGTDVPLGILPGGTGNVMATELAIPYDLPAAADIISAGNYELRSVDMGLVNETHKFLLRTVMGFEADMVNKTTQEQKNRFGLLAYAFTALNELRVLQPTTYRIKIDGEEHEIEGISAMIANSGNVALGGMTLSKNVNVSDGLLDLIIFTNANLATLINVTAAMVSGGDATEMQQLMHWQGREISIKANPPQSITVDGDLITPDEVKARVLPEKLLVAVPRTAAEGNKP